MAIRPVFMASNSQPFVSVEEVEFKYYSGFAASQAQKSITSLHAAFVERHPEYNEKILEISTKSSIALGSQLSAFNLRYHFNADIACSIENVFQAGKCFENGCQYTDLLTVSPYEAKRDPRLKESGSIVAFKLGTRAFPTSPTTFFYDWIYVNAVWQSQKLSEELLKYEAFTDIALNPVKSWNCQARSAALYVSLSKNGLLSTALTDPDSFRKIAYSVERTSLAESKQISILDLL